MSKAFFLLILFSLAGFHMSRAVSPMEYYNSLVAGGEEAGYRDGSFSLARFNEPQGLAFDDSGEKLYVADSGNHCIRVIDLNRNNEVTTLTGTDSIGAIDGPFSKATFNTPSLLVTLPTDQLAVYDDINHLIRLLDLKTRTVSTLAKGLSVRNMVYRAQDESLYFSQTDSQKLGKLNLKTLVQSSIFLNPSQIPSPGALCNYKDQLCVADVHLPNIYEVNTNNPPTSDSNSLPLTAIGNAKDVLALTSTDGNLYALEKGGFWVKAGLPEESNLPFPTAWGFLVNNQENQGALALFKFRDDLPVGFMASSRELRKFFIATENSIVSVKDYDFEKKWPAIEEGGKNLTDFNYPSLKPPHTFRILAIGTSRNSTAVPIPSDPQAPIDESVGSPKVLIFSKRLELYLNAESALRDSKTHFEVLNLTHRGEAISTYAYDEVPDIVKKYDIDLVIGLADQTGYKDYYIRPMTSEGIPSRAIDYEYLLKPLSERAISGVALDLIERCKKLKIPVSEKQDFPGDGYWSLYCNGDEQIQSDLREMTGRRLQLLQERLETMKTLEGKCPQLTFYYVPGGALPNDCCASFWKDVCTQYHLGFFDLSEPFDALRISFGPVYVNHFTSYGNDLVALLLDHYLIEKKLIPF